MNLCQTRARVNMYLEEYGFYPMLTSDPLSQIHICSRLHETSYLSYSLAPSLLTTSPSAPINTERAGSCTSLQVRKVLGRIDGGAVPPHVEEGLLADLLDLPGGLDDGLHELQVAAAQLGLGGH